MQKQMKELTPFNSTFFADESVKNTSTAANATNVTKSFSQIHEDNTTAASNKSEKSHENPNYSSNREAKEASTLKITSYAVKPNEILVRVQN
jgi:hypothetical protein